MEFQGDNVIHLIGTGDADGDELKKEIQEKTQRKAKVIVTDVNCDEKKDEVGRFNITEFQDFCKSFVSEVGTSSKGKWGNFCSSTYGGIVKVIMGAKGEEEAESFGCGFVIYKRQDCSIVMTCGHTFKDMDLSLPITVITCEFKSFRAQISFLSPVMDLCILRVEADLGAYVTPLPLFVGKISFGKKIFSISTPKHEMKVSKDFSNPELDNLLHTVWFSFSKGYVGHPFLVGVQSQNLRGKCIQFHCDGLTNRSSGAPIMNVHGKVLGIFITSTHDEEGCIVSHWALRLDSVKEYLKEVLGISQEDDITLMNIIELYFAGKRKKKGKKRSRAGRAR